MKLANLSHNDVRKLKYWWGSSRRCNQLQQSSGCLAPLPFRIYFRCNEFLQLGKRWQEKLRGPVCSSVKLSEGSPAALAIQQGGWYWDTSHHSQVWSWQRGKRERGGEPRCSGAENSTRRPTAVEGKKVEEYPSSFFGVEGKYRNVKARHQGREQQWSLHTFIGKLRS